MVEDCQVSIMCVRGAAGGKQCYEKICYSTVLWPKNTCGTGMRPLIHA